jgi:hypothetical protein
MQNCGCSVGPGVSPHALVVVSNTFVLANAPNDVAVPSAGVVAVGSNVWAFSVFGVTPGLSITMHARFAPPIVRNAPCATFIVLAVFSVPVRFAQLPIVSGFVHSVAYLTRTSYVGVAAVWYRSSAQIRGFVPVGVRNSDANATPFGDPASNVPPASAPGVPDETFVWMLR